ncbi:MAG: hypothetical protein JNM56_33885 [Planctomycetia bacterium]|nr:hypothetical protein [Planctomycetia bacterium]
MPVIKYTCPTCTAVIKTGVALPAGKLIRCPKCLKVFAPTGKEQPQPASLLSQPAPRPKETRLASPAARPKETQLQKPAGQKPKETKLSQPPGQKPKGTQLQRPSGQPSKETKLASGQNGNAPPQSRIPCPHCAAVLKWPGPPPVGKTIKCPKCTKTFVLPKEPAKPTATKPAAAKPTAAKLAASAKPQTVVRQIPCPHCKAKLKTQGPLPFGKTIRCPGCKKTFVLHPPRPKQSTQLAPQARPTKLAPRQPAKTALAPARPAQPRRTQLAPAAVRLACPACRAVLTSKKPIPAGASIRCPRCRKGLKLSARPQTQPAPKATAQLTKLAKPRVAPARPRSRLRLYAFAACAVGGLLLGVAFVLFGFGSRAIPAADWQPFALPGGGVRLQFPGTPSDEEATRHGPGVVAARRFEVVRTDADALFLLVRTDREADATRNLTFAELYAPERAYLLGKAPGQVVRETDLTLNGHPGKELEVELQAGGRMFARTFLVRGQPHDRTYLLVAIGHELQAGAGDAARFFDSFQIDAPAQRPD